MTVKMPKKGGRGGGSRPETGFHPPPPKLSRASPYPYGFPSFLFLFLPPPLYPPCLVTESSGMGRGGHVTFLRRMNQREMAQTSGGGRGGHPREQERGRVARGTD